MFLETLVVHVALSFFSALFAVALGFLGSIGLTSCQHYKNFFSAFAQMPAWVPPLFVAVSAFQVWPGHLPTGFWTVVVVQSLMNVGLVSVALSSVIESRLSGLAETCAVMGLSPVRFWWRISPAIKKETYTVFVAIFALCFFSLSIPLILGGGELLTLEMLALKELRLKSDVSMLGWVAFVQLLIFLFFSFWIRHHIQSHERQLNWPKPYKWIIAVVIAVLPTGILLFGWLTGLYNLNSVLQNKYIQELIQKSIGPTVSVGLGVGLLTIILGLVVLRLSHSSQFQKFIDNMIVPSATLIAAIFWFTPGLSQLPPLFKIMIAVTVSVFPFVYRLHAQNAMPRIHGQWQVAQVLGAGHSLAFWNVIAPGMTGILFKMASLAALWAVGDFALSSFVSNQDLTLAMHIHQMAANYRVLEAQSLIWILAVIGLFCYLIFTIGGYVSNRKS